MLPVTTSPPKAQLLCESAEGLRCPPGARRPVWRSVPGRSICFASPQEGHERAARAKPGRAARRSLYAGRMRLACFHEGCPESCPPQKYRMRHGRCSHSGERPFTGPLASCGRRFAGKSLLRGTQATDKARVCPDAGGESAFSAPRHLTRHVRLHSGGQPFVCPQENCGKRFAQRWAGRVHLRAHSGGTSGAGGKSGVSPVESDAQRVAQRSVALAPGRTRSPSKIFDCPRDGCERSFASYRTLKQHWIAQHTPGETLVGSHESCGQVFDKSSALTGHQRVHSGERSGVSPVESDAQRCGQRSVALAPGRARSPGKIFDCPRDGCGLSFPSSQTLKQHWIAQHTREQTLVCPHESCGKVFDSSSALAGHLRVHYASQFPRVQRCEGCGTYFEEHKPAEQMELGFVSYPPPLPGELRGAHSARSSVSRDDGFWLASLPFGVFGTDEPDGATPIPLTDADRAFWQALVFSGDGES